MLHLCDTSGVRAVEHGFRALRVITADSPSLPRETLASIIVL